MLLDRWITRALKSRVEAFKKTARTMRDRRGIIINAIEQGISNGRVEGLNNKVRLIIRRAYGFHSADAALALVMLSCGPINWSALGFPDSTLVAFCSEEVNL